MSNFSKNKKFLLKKFHNHFFIANWSLSETPVKFRERFLKIIENYSDYDFGSFDVKTMELVYNDWYQREKFVKKLYEFEL